MTYSPNPNLLNSCDYTSLSGGKTYYLRVTVTDAAGNSAKSSTKNQAITKVYYWDRYTAVETTMYSYSWTKGSNASYMFVGCYNVCCSTWSNLSCVTGVYNTYSVLNNGQYSFSGAKALNYNTFANWNGCLNGCYSVCFGSYNGEKIVSCYLIVNGFKANSCEGAGSYCGSSYLCFYYLKGQVYTSSISTSTVYTQGTYVTSVQTTSSTTYTSGTVNSDGYWYVYTGSN